MVIHKLEQRLALVLAVLSIAMALAVAFALPTFIHPEAYGYVPYLSASGHSLFAKIFNLASMESPQAFRVRPVAECVDMFDAYMLIFLNSWFPWGFRHASTPLLMIASVWFLALSLKRLLPTLPGSTLVSLAIFVISAPVVGLSQTLYFRSGKMLATMAVSATLLAWAIYRDRGVSSLRGRHSGLKAAAVIVGFLLLCLSDEIAVGTLVVFLLVSLVESLRAGRLSVFVPLALIPLALFALFVQFLAPLVYQSFTPVSFSTRYLSSSFLGLDPGALGQAISINALHLGMLLGQGQSLGHTLLLLVGLLVVLLLGERFAVAPAPSEYRPAILLRIPVLWLLGFVAVSYMMILRHPAVTTGSVRVAPYFFPATILAYVAVLILLAWFGVLATPLRRVLVMGLLCIAVVSNAESTSEIQGTLMSHLGKTSVESEIIARVVASGKCRSSDLEKLRPEATQFLAVYYQRTHPRDPWPTMIALEPSTREDDAR